MWGHKVTELKAGLPLSHTLGFFLLFKIFYKPKNLWNTKGKEEKSIIGLRISFGGCVGGVFHNLHACRNTFKAQEKNNRKTPQIPRRARGLPISVPHDDYVFERQNDRIRIYLCDYCHYNQVNATLRSVKGKTFNKVSEREFYTTAPLSATAEMMGLHSTNKSANWQSCGSVDLGRKVKNGCVTIRSFGLFTDKWEYIRHTSRFPFSFISIFPRQHRPPGFHGAFT